MTRAGHLPSEDLQPLVEQWLPTQRWFGGKGVAFELSLRELAELPYEQLPVTIWLADVAFAGTDGTDPAHTSTYQLPLLIRDEPDTGLEHVLVGAVERDGQVRWVYDALHDNGVTQAWLAGIRDEATAGPLSFQRFADAAEIPVDATSLVLTTEQSNTSLVFGDVAILKVFRRLEPGINPDIEVHAALSRRGAKNVAKVLGSVTAEIDGGQVSLAMLQEFLTTASNGWELAKASVRDLMAEADLHAAEAGGDFASEAERLGVATADVHLDLAAAFGTESFGADERRARAAAMHARLDAAMPVVDGLAELAEQLRAVFEEFAAADVVLATQRIHGDLHLGQVLRTVHGWVLLDFEGEPASPLAQRRVFDSPLRDVAGMLRSFDYAARFQFIEAAPSAQLAYRANEWAVRNREAFIAGYVETSGHDIAAELVALRAFEIDKAVYEAVYETRTRPAWLQIPLASLHRLVGAGDLEGSA
ncbi:MAG TPA: aminoglycoside phosphotransferase [Jatrophihabitantaceae bacterium]|jgi:maltokinase|nr:aminoglycoside phosphotransferase [Jatrophihabitantaceae bacterium]